MFHTTDDKTEKAVNGEETTDSEHPANEGTAEEEEAVINTCYYDKSKSFFDNLSCNDSRYFGLSRIKFLITCRTQIVALCPKKKDKRQDFTTLESYRGSNLLFCLKHLETKL